MKKYLLLSIAIFLQGCAQSGYKQFYKSYVDPRTAPEFEVIGENELPKLYGSGDFDSDIKALRAKRYVVVGVSSFNGGYEDTKNALTQAKRIGATVVLVNSEYTGTQTSTAPLFLPSNQTTYHSGIISGGGVYGGYNGTSTTYGTTVVPITTQQRRYEQTAVYLVKSNKKAKFGLLINDLNPQQRLEIERNTGAYIDVVFEGTPAFYSNVMSGDILLAVNAISVKDLKHALKLMADVPASSKNSTLTVLRNNVQKEIVIEF